MKVETQCHLFLFLLVPGTVQQFLFSYVNYFTVCYRNCIGQNFAVYEEKLFLSVFLRNFEISLDDSKPPTKPTCFILLHPDQVCLKLTKRLN